MSEGYENTFLVRRALAFSDGSMDDARAILLADKLDEETKTEVETAIAQAKEVKDGDDLDEIVAKKEALSQASMKIGQAMYSQQQEQQEGDEAPKDDNTVDADFTEKKSDDEEEEKKEEKK